MGIGMFLFWGLFAAVIVTAVLGFGDAFAGRSSSSPSMAPLDILRARYARGEIDRAEFEERRRGLSGKQARPT